MSQHTIQIELEGLIKLLAQNLYSDPDVFLREMLQNAHDSIIKRKTLASETDDSAPPGRIVVRVDRDARSVTIEDNGAGLTEDEVHTYLSTIGRSGTRELRDRLESGNRAGAIDLIGQFGIGLLSAFIVADSVIVETRARAGDPLRWESGGGKEYQLVPGKRTAVGTTVSLLVRSDFVQYLDAARLRGIIVQYADFIGIPVYIGDDDVAANSVDAPWHRKIVDPVERRSVYYSFWERRFLTETSLDLIPLDHEFDYLEATTSTRRKGRILGVLGITDQHVPDVNTRGVVDVYVKRMFVSGANREMLPAWARFIQGVVQCDSLTPNAARDNVMRDEVLHAAQLCLGRVIVEHLRNLAGTAPQKLKDIMRWHSYHVLGMSVQDEHRGFFADIADLVPMETDQGPMTLPEYLAQTKQPVIHYVTERGSATQYFVLCQARGLRVVDAAEPFAERFLKRYVETWPSRARLVHLDISGGDHIFEPVDDQERARFRPLELAVTHVFPDLRCIPKVVRFLPAEVPAVLTETDHGKTRREMQEVSQNLAMPEFIRTMVSGFLNDNRQPLTLNLNVANPTIQRLADTPGLVDSEVGAQVIVSMFNNALLLLARAQTSENIRRMFSQASHILELLISATEARDAARAQIDAARAEAVVSGDFTRAAHVVCFVAMPFGDPSMNRVFEALRAVLEDFPYCWEVKRADHEVHGKLDDNLRVHLTSASVFVAEISDLNPNVLVEVGRMEVIGRPILLLRHAGAKDVPVDIRGHVHQSYELEGDIAGLLKEALPKRKDFVCPAGEHFLSVAAVRTAFPYLDAENARKLASSCSTIQALLRLPADEVTRRNGLPRGLVEDALAALKQKIEAL